VGIWADMVWWQSLPIRTDLNFLYFHTVASEE
jgi:hypothetical protein